MPRCPRKRQSRPPIRLAPGIAGTWTAKATRCAIQCATVAGSVVRICFSCSEWFALYSRDTGHGDFYPALRGNVCARPLFPRRARNNGPGCAFLPVRLASFCESTGMTESEHQREVFAALVQPHLPTLWRFIRRLVRETQDAEDLVQEACLNA